MIRLARFKSVRGRLLALLVAITLPIAILMALTALTTYRTVIAAINTTQMRMADDYAVRTRVWYRGALRSLLTTGSALLQDGRPAGDCELAGQRSLSQVTGYRAFQVVSKRGVACSASLDPGVGSAELASALATLKAKQLTQVWAGSEPAVARYDRVALGDKVYLAVFAKGGEANSAFGEGVLLVEPQLLDQVFDLGESDEGLKVALISATGGVVVARGSSDLESSWLPEREVVPGASERWRAQSRSGETRDYAARIVAEPDFYIVASFNDDLAQAARTQFLVLLVAPLMTLVLLCVVYLRAIDRHCINWLRGIEGAARARLMQPSVRAAIAPDMPVDIRNVAVAFNTMVEEQEVRQRKLQSALDDNRFLVRELHHRVKNSLQVVQSYIGLTKRDYSGEARMALADAECRVHVLSAAYRFTLADGEMQPVRVDLFIDDVVTMISNLLRGRDQWISSVVETHASLSVDRIIPLGFLIVDVMSRALRGTPGVTLRITVRDLDESTIEVAMVADREIAHSAPPKLFAGLVAQIEAVEAEAPAARSLGVWRIGHQA